MINYLFFFLFIKVIFTCASSIACKLTIFFHRVKIKMKNLLKRYASSVLKCSSNEEKSTPAYMRSVRGIPSGHCKSIYVCLPLLWACANCLQRLLVPNLWLKDNIFRSRFPCSTVSFLIFVLFVHKIKYKNPLIH